LRLFRWIVLGVVAALVVALFWILRIPGLSLLEDPGASISVTVPSARGRTRDFTLGPANPNWTPLSRISPALRTCVVASEDDRFYAHAGLDLVEMGRSLRTDLKEGRYARGGSTITMQLARTLFLSREKTLRRKILEAMLAWRLEHALPKNRILELYLNVVEWGPDLRGIGAAARTYYGKPPSVLTWGESATLAVMLPNPERFQPSVRPLTLRRRQQRLVARLLREGRIPAAAREEALAVPSPRILFEEME